MTQDSDLSCVREKKWLKIANLNKKNLSYIVAMGVHRAANGPWHNGEGNEMVESFPEVKIE